MPHSLISEVIVHISVVGQVTDRYNDRLSFTNPTYRHRLLHLAEVGDVCHQFYHLY